MRLILTVLLAGLAGAAIAQDSPDPSRAGRRQRQDQCGHRRPGHARRHGSAGKWRRSSPPTCARPACSRRWGPAGLPGYSVEEAGNPAYPSWRNAGVAALVSGYIEPRADGRMTLACYLHDVTAGRELARQGFAVNAQRLAPGRA